MTSHHQVGVEAAELLQVVLMHQLQVMVQVQVTKVVTVELEHHQILQDQVLRELAEVVEV